MVAGAILILVVAAVLLARSQHRYETELLDYMQRMERHLKPSSIARTSSYWAQIEAVSTYGQRTSSYFQGVADATRPAPFLDGE